MLSVGAGMFHLFTRVAFVAFDLRGPCSVSPSPSSELIPSPCPLAAVTLACTLVMMKHALRNPSQKHVMWACPTCAEKMETGSVPSPTKKQNTRKDDKKEEKEDKKRPRAASTPAPVTGSPKGSDEVGGSFTIPKRRKEQNAPTGPASPRSLKEKKEKRREKEERRAAREEKTESVDRSTNTSRGSNRMAKGTKQPKVAPRVGLGLSDDAEASASTGGLLVEACADAGAGTSQDDSTSPKGTSMYSADDSDPATASAVASETAAEIATAPMVSAPPKALGLKKLLHRRVQYDEIEAAGGNPSATFSPKKLLKHRILSGSNPDTALDPDNPPEPEVDDNVKTEVMQNGPVHPAHEENGHQLFDWNTAPEDSPTQVPSGDPNSLGGVRGDEYLAADQEERAEDPNRYTSTDYQSGGGELRDGNNDMIDSRTHAEGLPNGQSMVEDSSWAEKQPVSGTNEEDGGREVEGPYHNEPPAGGHDWWDGRDEGMNGVADNVDRDDDRQGLSEGSPGRDGGVDVRKRMRWSEGRPEERDEGRAGELTTYEQAPRGPEVRGLNGEGWLAG